MSWYGRVAAALVVMGNGIPRARVGGLVSHPEEGEGIILRYVIITARVDEFSTYIIATYMSMGDLCITIIS